MTLNNWKELCIGGNKLKRLVRVSDGLVLFELPSGPDYNEPFWIKGDGVDNNSRCFFSTTIDPSTLSPIVASYDKKNWTPIEWENPYGNNYWISFMIYGVDDRKRYFMRDSEVPIGFGSNSNSHLINYQEAYGYPSLKIGGNINSLLCKNFSTLTDISDLSNCFYDFINARSILNIDELLLPSKKIGQNCYSQFASTTGLKFAGSTIEIEDIPSNGCRFMFIDCENLVKGPKFTNLKSIGDYGLESAFRGCSSLSSIELPSTPISLGQYGFREAFSGSGIKTVENLNLSGIGPHGCEGMFLSCADLEKVDGLSVENFNTYALTGMFSDCSSLTSVQDLYIDNSEYTNKKNGYSKCESMFKNCNSLLSVGGIIKGVYGQYALRNMFNECKSLKDASQLSIEVNYGQNYCNSMFYGCSELESMPVLLSGEYGTSSNKYYNMFRNCTKLKNVNPLPDVKPIVGMYRYMFQNCTSMTDAPEIMLSTANVGLCMSNMFNGCTNLSSVTVHFKTWPKGTQLNGWLSGVAPTGIFRCPAELPDQRGNGRIPEGWTKVDL